MLESVLREVSWSATVDAVPDASGLYASAEGCEGLRDVDREMGETELQCSYMSHGQNSYVGSSLKGYWAAFVHGSHDRFVAWSLRIR